MIVSASRKNEKKGHHCHVQVRYLVDGLLLEAETGRWAYVSNGRCVIHSRKRIYSVTIFRARIAVI